MLDYETIGLRLRAARKAAGRTQAQVARRLGVTPQNVSLMEAGQPIDLVKLEQFADYVGLPLVSTSATWWGILASAYLRALAASSATWTARCSTC